MWKFPLDRRRYMLLSIIDGRAKKVELVPNGANVGFFASAMCADTVIPAEIAPLPRPIIGFVGKIAGWLDFKLLASLAKTHPDWSFVFVGMCDRERKLSACPGYSFLKEAHNVHFLGPKPHNSLPGYLKAFDVCIIPYLLEGQVLASSSLKLYEYLACGKPIVSVDISHVAQFEPLVYIGKNIERFNQAFLRSLAEDSEELHRRRLRAAMENSWEERVAKIIRIIEMQLKADTILDKVKVNHEN
jgi:glycosyltransferase involved in cell wall biosynthesis